MTVYTKTGFELKTCGRCGGCGRYSFNLMHGSTCYGCGGTGKVLSKRGSAARKFFLESCLRPIASIVVGDLVYVSRGIGSKRFRKVMSVTADNLNAHHVIVGFKDFSYNMNTGSPDMEIVSSTDEHAQKLAEAMAYQSTLDERGKVKGPRVLAREAAESTVWGFQARDAAMAAKKAEDAEVLAMADYYCAY